MHYYYSGTEGWYIILPYLTSSHGGPCKRDCFDKPLIVPGRGGDVTAPLSDISGPTPEKAVKVMEVSVSPPALRPMLDNAGVVEVLGTGPAWP